MFRYLGFNWDTRNAQQVATAQRLDASLVARPGWQAALRRDGLHAFTAGQEPGVNGVYALPFAQGVVLGRLFRRAALAAAPREVELCASDCDRICKTGGRSLVTDFWGRYVAIFWSNRCGAQVLRDPSGALPCFRVQVDGVDIVFSWLEDVMDLAPGPLPLHIDWDAVTACMLMGQVSGRGTALQGVGHVVPGELTSLGMHSRPPVALWSGLAFAQRPLDLDPHDASQQLREAVVGCARSWSSCYGKLLLRLSGGVDSAIVLGCLRLHRQAHQISALNYHSEGADSDERNYARLAAERAGVMLIERERDARFRLEDVLRVAHMPVPQSHVGRMGTNCIDAELASALGAHVIFTGGGGDQLFFERRCTWPAADYLKLHGLGRGFFRAALDAARLGRVSVWRSIRQAIVDVRSHHDLMEGISKRWLLPARLTDASIDLGRFMGPDVHAAIAPPAGTPQLPLGKLHQLRDIVTPRGYYDPFLRDAMPELVHPLMAQPVMELCLALPTYVLTMGGRGRGLARHAFVQDMPREIATRRTKGGMNEHATSILHNSLPFVKDLLLNGQLVRQGLLDRRRVEATLSGSLEGVYGNLSEIHHCIAVEAWILKCTAQAAR